MHTVLYPKPDEWHRLVQRPSITQNRLEETVRSILANVKDKGDAAIIAYNREFGGVDLDDLAVSPDEIDGAANKLDNKLISAIKSAAENIDLFHRNQMRPKKKIETSPGVYCWRKQIAIKSVGLYIPGGSAPLFSTLLMLGVPAKIAGCSQIVVCSPPDKNGRLDASILFTAELLGIDKIYKIGGAQAIGAMAYGSATVPVVDKIFGPGNQYVTMAKQLVNFMGTAIDLPAGPSEVVIIADQSAPASFIAADLIAQAEHGPDSQVLMLTDREPLLKRVKAEVEKQMLDLPRASIAEQSLKNSRLILFKNLDEAVDFSNYYAPEHLIIMTGLAHKLVSRIIHAGSVFIGAWTPEAAGDYASGTNHTLPTGGFARSYSGVSLDSFYKNITYQELSPEGLTNIGPIITVMAEAEQLDGHARSVHIRLEALQKRIG